MIRPILIELALFLTPFVVYAIFLWATKADVLHPELWSLKRVVWLGIAALVLMLGSFVVLAQWAARRADQRDRHRHHRGSGRGDAASGGGRLQGGADGPRSRHRHRRRRWA